MRSEEEQTRDLEIHNKRYTAQEIIDGYKKIRRRAMLAALISAVILLCAFLPLMLGAYDSEKIILLTALAAAYAVLVAVIYFAVGAYGMKSLPRFTRAAGYIRRWAEALEDIERIETKQAEGTLLAADAAKQEERLLGLCERISEFEENAQNKN